MNRHNSTFRSKPSKLKRSGIKRSLKSLKRSYLPRSQKPMKKKREPLALTRAKRIAKERDNYTCQFPGCGKTYKGIDAHHKAKVSQRPDLKFDPENMITLCRPHHRWIDHNHDEAVHMGLLDLETYELAQKNRKEAA